MIDRTIKESVIKAMNNKPVVLITGYMQYLLAQSN